MRVGDPVDLLVHRPQHIGMTMPQARYCCSAGRIEVLVAVVVDDGDAVPCDGERQRVAQAAMEDVAHWGQCTSTASQPRTGLPLSSRSSVGEMSML